MQKRKYAEEKEYVRNGEKRERRKSMRERKIKDRERKRERERERERKNEGKTERKKERKKDENIKQINRRNIFKYSPVRSMPPT